MTKRYPIIYDGGYPRELPPDDRLYGASVTEWQDPSTDDAPHTPGDTRFNLQEFALEVWNGADWILAFDAAADRPDGLTYYPYRPEYLNSGIKGEVDEVLSGTAYFSFPTLDQPFANATIISSAGEEAKEQEYLPGDEEFKNAGLESSRRCTVRPPLQNFWRAHEPILPEAVTGDFWYELNLEELELFRGSGWIPVFDPKASRPPVGDCYYPHRGSYANSGVTGEVDVCNGGIAEHYFPPQAVRYDNAGVVTEPEDPTHKGYLPGSTAYNNAGLDSDRRCTICPPLHKLTIRSNNTKLESGVKTLLHRSEAEMAKVMVSLEQKTQTYNAEVVMFFGQVRQGQVDRDPKFKVVWEASDPDPITGVLTFSVENNGGTLELYITSDEAWDKLEGRVIPL